MPKVSSSEELPEGNLEDSLWKLVLAAGPAKLRIIQKVIDAGVDVNKQDERGRTCLFFAVDKKRYKLVQILLDAGANPNLCNRKIWINNTKYESPLHRSLQLADRKLFSMLLNSGGDIDDLKKPEFTRIMFDAIERGRPRCAEVLELFLQHGVDVNCTRDTDGSTMLFDAACRNRLNIVEFLLEWGANPNIPYRIDQLTPIFITTFSDEDARCAKLLIAGGADVNWKDLKGRPLLDVAIRAQKRSLIECLVKHIALLDSAGKFVDPSNAALINQSTELTEFFCECNSELEVLKCSAMAHFGSYYDLLVDNNRLKRCARDVSLKNAFKCSHLIDIYPIYGEYLSYCYDRERDRALLEERAIVNLSRMFRVDLEGQSSIIGEIFKHLRKPDLRSLCTCLPDLN